MRRIPTLRQLLVLVGLAPVLLLAAGAAPRSVYATSYVASLSVADGDAPAGDKGDHDHARPQRPVAQSQKEGVTVVLPAAFDVSPPLRSAPHAPHVPAAPPSDEGAPEENPSLVPPSNTGAPDAAVQTVANTPSPSSSDNFEGIQNPNGYVPPDTNGDVNADYYVEWVNAEYAVFNKSDGSIAGGGAFSGNAPWSSWSGQPAGSARRTCADQNQGDPIVKYDRLSNRWLLTQFAFAPGNTATGTQGPYLQCIAVSTSSDPLGTYYLYAYQISSSNLNDYPKVGIWPDGYYFTFNSFSQSTGGFVGTTVAAADRVQIVAGNSAAKMLIRTNSTTTFSLLPADLDGTTLPPNGAAETFAQLVSPQLYSGNAPYALQLFTLTPNFSASTLTWSGPTTLNVAPFSLGDFTDWIVQPPNSATESLDPLADRLMYRLAYRNLGSKQVMTVTHTVDVTGASSCQPGCLAAPRWYQLERTSGSWSVAQQSTFATDNLERWMSSMAIDHDGNLGMVYSTSGYWLSYPSGAVGWPSVAYTGRLATDAPSTLEDEHVLVAGDQAQTATCSGSPCGRWGDYSSATIDPTDDCTFWIAGEYFHSGGLWAAYGRNWHTRIGSFRFPGCMSYAPTSGPFGVNVVIKGRQYEDATSVTVGGTDAPTFSADSSAHTLTAHVPEGASSGPIAVTTPEGTFTSETSFSVVPGISDFTPTSGVVGDSVTISGGPFTGTTAVRFNGVNAAFSVDSDTQITATVPAGATTGLITVVNGAANTSATPFSVKPDVTGFTPSSGHTASTVTITGTTFTGTTSVKFNGLAAASFSASASSITATVPANATWGPISVTTPSGTGASSGSFVVVPTFASLSASSGVAGTTIAFNGTGLSGAVGVDFHGAPATFTIVGGSKINAIVPVDATTGPITVTLDSGQTVSSTAFKPLPKITSLSPAAPVGTTATVTGTNFTGATVVKIGALTVGGYSIDSATQITFTIPDAALTGKVSVTTPAGTAVSAGNLLVLPTISFLTPTHAAAGVAVTLTGATFTGTTGVKFNGVSASFSVLSPTSLRATVPTAATSGTVSVTNAGGTASGPTFTVDPKITGISPTAAPGGTVVTIGGTGLGSPIDVSFNGTTAAIVSASATSVKATVPVGATTGVISVTTAAGTAASASVFKPLPKITGFSPPNGPIGTVVTLTGSNLLGATALKIGSIVVTGFSVDDATHITATIPDTAVTGAFSVTTPAGAGNSPTSFGVLARIDTMSPTEATTGTTVTFTGQTFAGVTAVKFNGVSSGSITRVSSTVLKAVVPSGATTGTVSVTNAGGVATGPVFTVDPKIAGFSPTSAVAGTTVTVSGSGLAGATDVSFNGVSATIVTSAATQVRALVPNNATTGTISVTTPAGSATSVAIFKPLPKITGFSPPSGPRGTTGVILTGSNFLGASAVKIGSVAVTDFTVDSALQITLTIPPTAATGRFTVTTPAGSGASVTSFTVTASTLKARRLSRRR